MGEFDHIIAAMHASPLWAELDAIGRSGDFAKLEANAAKRHHYVPQFILREFCDPADGGRRLFQMPTASREAPVRVGARDAAVRPGLYRVRTPEGTWSNQNEGYLALVESHASSAIRELVGNAPSLAAGERATIAFFVALQTMRTPSSAAQVTDLANMAFQHAASELYSDRAAFAESYRDQYGPEVADEEIEAFRQTVIDEVRSGGMRVSGADGAAFGTALTQAVSLVPQIIAFDWVLLRASDGSFVTSDRGFSIHDPAPPFPWTAQSLLSSAVSETLIPLSDGTALLMRPGTASCRLEVRDVNKSEIDGLNLRTYGWADRYVFAQRQSTLDDLRSLARSRPRDVVRPKPYCEVVLLEVDPEDQSVADENVRRGWPPSLPGEDGSPRDYIVIPTHVPQPELRARADELAEERARKRLGPAAEGAPGRISHRPVDPLDLVG